MELQDLFGSRPALQTRKLSPAIPYPAIAHHGLIGDRRTAALVAADGTLDWLCLPDYDSPIIFGALMDWEKGGMWRCGPSLRTEGQQRYVPGTMVLETRWSLAQGELLLWDLMLWPETNRAPEQAPVRAIVRKLRCTKGRVRCHFDLRPASDFRQLENAFSQHSSGFSLQFGELPLRVWASAPLRAEQSCCAG